jgi:iduronate 2-sulfatase
VRRPIGVIGVLTALATATACRQSLPATRGVVLVLASGFADPATTSQLHALARLRASGRAFDSAFAPDPDPARSRAALLGSGPNALSAMVRARGVALAGVGGGAALPLDASTLDLALDGGVSDAGTASRLEAWIRDQRGRFVVIAAIGSQPASTRRLPPPATLAGASARELPRIAVGDLGFTESPGLELRPPAWSEPARERARVAALERSLAADRELDRLVALVQRASEGAAFVLVGDPRADSGAHGVLERRDALFDDTLHAGLVVAMPGMPRPGTASERLVSTLDAAPTLLQLLGDPNPTPASGARSLVPLVADPGGEGRRELVSSVPRRAGRVGRTVRTARYRYTEWPDGSRELYDHGADPREITNLADRPGHDETLSELSSLLRARTPSAEASDEESPAGRTAGARSARPRNVLLIVVDDLNTQVGAWGAPVKTPAIDRLAARGVRFENAYVQVAMCSPSRVSMLTGWLPERTGVWQNEDPPRPAHSLPLQELFAAHGARTISIGKIYHSPADFHWDLREEHPELVEERDPTAAGVGSGLWVKAPGGDLDQPDGRRARRAAQLLLERRSRPSFVAVGFVRPHVRWVAPERYFALYPPESVVLPSYPVDDLLDVPAIAVKTQPQPIPGLPLAGREPPGLAFDPVFLRQAVAAYEACVSFADAQVAVLLEALDRGDLWNDTVVVLVGDNGFQLGEHDGMLRKDTLFEEALRVPLIVVAPGLPRPGTVVRAPVEALDIYPTIAALAGLEPPPGLDGESLLPLLANPEGQGRGAAFSYRRVQPPERAWSLRTERERYTLWPDGSEELYDRCPCNSESPNLARDPRWAARKRRLRARLEALVVGASSGKGP